MNPLDAIKDIALRENTIEWDTNHRYYDVLIEVIEKRDTDNDSTIDAAFSNPEKIYWALALLKHIDKEHRRTKELTIAYETFAKEFQAEPSKERRLSLALDYYQKFRGKEARMKKARKVFEKYLELDVFLEGYRKRSEEIQVLIEKTFVCIGHLLADSLNENFPMAESREKALVLLLAEYGFEQVAVEQIHLSPRDRTRIEAAVVLRRLAQVAPAGSTIFSFSTFRLLSGFSQNLAENTWLQIEALKTLFAIYRQEALDLFHLRLITEKKESDDNLFVRKWIAQFIGDFLKNQTGFEMLRDFLMEPEPSDYVRMAAVRALGSFPYAQSAPILTALCTQGPRRDPSPQVRAACIEGLVQSAITDPDINAHAQCAQLLGRYLLGERAMFAQRICLEQMVRFVKRPKQNPERIGPEKEILLAIGKAIENPDILVKVRYWAGIYKEQILFAMKQTLQSTLVETTNAVAEMNQGSKKRLPENLAQGDLDLVGRSLAFLSLGDFGYYGNGKKGKAVVTKGEDFRFQWWRFLFEITNPSPDKRRNFNHTKGRHFRGMLRAHSDILGELTTTKVPGEPLVIWDAGSWRRHIPLVDDCLSLLRPFRFDPEVRLYSSMGITILNGPKGFSNRLRFYIKTTTNYKMLADLRNSFPTNKQSPDIRKYIEALREICGIEIRFEPYQDSIGDETFSPVDPAFSETFGSKT